MLVKSIKKYGLIKFMICVLIFKGTKDIQANDIKLLLKLVCLNENSLLIILILLMKIINL